MQTTEQSNSSPIDDLEAMGNMRTQRFALLYLGSQDRVWSAGQAHYRGDLLKRSRNLLKLPAIQGFLKKYGPPPNQGKVEVTKDSVLMKLAQIGSGRLMASLDTANSSPTTPMCR